MFDLEKSIKKWRKSLRKNQALEDGYIAELESHLRDEFENLRNSGLGEEDAFDRASDRAIKSNFKKLSREEKREYKVKLLADCVSQIIVKVTLPPELSMASLVPI